MKGRLRNILHRGLFDKICEIVDKGKCDYKQQTVFRFLAELRRIEVWPLEDTMAKSSIETMLERLNSFEKFRHEQKKRSFIITDEDAQALEPNIIIPLVTFASQSSTYQATRG